MKPAALVLAAAVLCAPPARAEAGGWLLFKGVGADQPERLRDWGRDNWTRIELHTGRISTKGKMVTAWLRWSFPKNGPGALAGSTLEQEFDCPAMRSRTLQGVTYRKDGTSVKIVTPTPWEEPLPGSDGADAVDFVCDHPPFTGWMDDPHEYKTKVTEPERRGESVLRWRKYSKSISPSSASTSVRQDEYDCKGGRQRVVYIADSSDENEYVNGRREVLKWVATDPANDVCSAAKVKKP